MASLTAVIAVLAASATLSASPNAPIHLPTSDDEAIALLTKELASYRALQIAPVNPTQRGMREFETSVKAKASSRRRLEKALTKLEARTKNPRVKVWASCHRAGAALETVDKLLGAPLPEKVQGYRLTEEDRSAMREQLAGMTVALTETAIEKYQACLKMADEADIESEVTITARQELTRAKSLLAP